MNGYKNWPGHKGLFIPVTHEPGKQPGYMGGKKGLKKSKLKPEKP